MPHTYTLETGEAIRADGTRELALRISPETILMAQRMQGQAVGAPPPGKSYFLIAVANTGLPWCELNQVLEMSANHLDAEAAEAEKSPLNAEIGRRLRNQAEMLRELIVAE
jgi:hypothetical protein